MLLILIGRGVVYNFLKENYNFLIGILNLTCKLFFRVWTFLLKNSWLHTFKVKNTIVMFFIIL